MAGEEEMTGAVITTTAAEQQVQEKDARIAALEAELAAAKEKMKKAEPDEPDQNPMGEFFAGSLAIGAYGHNDTGDPCASACALLIFPLYIFTGCTQPQPWDNKHEDGMLFDVDEPAWGNVQNDLRREFESLLPKCWGLGRESDLTRLTQQVRGCYGCCLDMPAYERVINEEWCPKVNQELLHRNGYSVRAERWEFKPQEGAPCSHLRLGIFKYRPLVVASVTASMERDSMERD